MRHMLASEGFKAWMYTAGQLTAYLLIEAEKELCDAEAGRGKAIRI